MYGNIKILSVEECYDPDYGNYIIKYGIGTEFVSYLFSDLETCDVSNDILKEEVLKHLKDIAEIKNFPTWNNLSEELLGAITFNPFDMHFIEHDDDEWNQEKADTVSSEAANWKSLDGVVTTEERDCYITIFAGAMCSVNWYLHPIWG